MSIQNAFLYACSLDVAVLKPGNVSWASPGHGMTAQQFIDSAQAAAAPLCDQALRLGERIESAVQASWSAAECNTNLGIVLLCAPLAMAAQRLAGPATPTAWQSALEEVLDTCDMADTQAVYRAIARANPGGLGSAPSQDVREVPSMRLRAAMALAAHRDLIALQYKDGLGTLFDLVAARLMAEQHAPATPDRARSEIQRVQGLFLTLVSTHLDSHILRKHGVATAEEVRETAKHWLQRLERGETVNDDPEFLGWDAQLKSRRINPGTSADLTVAVLMMMRWLEQQASPKPHGTLQNVAQGVPQNVPL